jgi:hypothetical protein
VTTAVSNSEIILLILVVAIPIPVIAFVVGARKAYDQIGKGGLSVEFESDNPRGMHDSGGAAEAAGAREDELRQMLEAKAYRQRARGESPLDVDEEMARVLAEQRPAAPGGDDPALREEVRQLVVARNARRARQGKEPLDVDAEVARQLQELENLGQ